MVEWIDGMGRKLGLLLILPLFSCLAYAQDFDWQLRTKGGEEYSHVALERLSNDTLYFLQQTNYSDWIHVDSVTQLRRERREAILPATLIGAAAGGAIGFAVKPVARDQEQANVYSAAFGVIVGGVAGFLVGSNIQSDDVYDLQPLSRQSKADVLKKAME